MLITAVGFAILTAFPLTGHAEEPPYEPALDDATEGQTGAPKAFDLWKKSPIGPIRYRPARGIRFGTTGLNIGGFGIAEFDRNEGEALEVAFDTLSFLVLFEPIESFRIFAEVEVGDLFVHEARGATESDPRLEVERLYGELSLSDRFNLQFGKFQTPVGRWNLVPAEPFVWTASDPVQLDTAFDEHQTGLSVHGTLFPSAGTLDYWIYGQVLDPLDGSDTPTPGSRSVGTRVEFTRPLRDWSIGGSLLATQRKGDWAGLAGIDVEIHWRNFELLSEVVFQDGEIPDRRLAGIFLQWRYEVLPDLHLIARYEFFDRLGSKHDDVHLGDLGFAWQPIDWLLLKATYRVADQETEDVERGLSSSISVVF